MIGRTDATIGAEDRLISAIRIGRLQTECLIERFGILLTLKQRLTSELLQLRGGNVGEVVVGGSRAQADKKNTKKLIIRMNSQLSSNRRRVVKLEINLDNRSGRHFLMGPTYDSSTMNRQCLMPPSLSLRFTVKSNSRVIALALLRQPRSSVLNI
ncbi:hypothetical protein OUZ56_025127 [Daphnia magna]|uniref:Uncharacterized protein n=1 Tax=Daphnia magna TaxID=35525 RepID=A0ABQ9ZIX2_9CRUS|nr:hypothetical protein OUZ56_025127 [Daphnia magna]